MTNPPTPPHDKKLTFIGVAMTEKRNPKTSPLALIQVRDELEPMLKSIGYFENAPFSWVTIAIRYGHKNADIPHYQPINKKYGDLPLSIEVSAQDMQIATTEELKTLFRNAALRALIHAGEKHKLPIEELNRLM